MRKWLFIVIIFLLTACSKEVSNPITDRIEMFEMTDQNNTTYSSNQLEEKVWLANFIFTSCKTICPPMTMHLKELQQQLEEKQIDVEIVSFSVDPTVDSPKKLKEFITKFQVKEDNWHLMTGYTQKYINDFAKNNFHTLVDKPENTTQVIHGTNLYLVDKNGILKKSYDGVQNPPYEEIIEDIQNLLND